MLNDAKPGVVAGFPDCQCFCCIANRNEIARRLPQGGCTCREYETGGLCECDFCEISRKSGQHTGKMKPMG